MTPPRCVVWTNPDQAPVLAEVLHGAGIELNGAGCPDPARTGQVASALSCPPIDDLRSAYESPEFSICRDDIENINQQLAAGARVRDDI